MSGQKIKIHSTKLAIAAISMLVTISFFQNCSKFNANSSTADQPSIIAESTDKTSDLIAQSVQVNTQPDVQKYKSSDCDLRQQAYLALQSKVKAGMHSAPVLNRSVTPCRYMSDEFILAQFSYNKESQRYGWFNYYHELDKARVLEMPAIKLSISSPNISIRLKANLKDSLAGFLDKNSFTKLGQLVLQPAASFVNLSPRLYPLDGGINPENIAGNDLNIDLDADFKPLIERGGQVGQTVLLPFVIFAYNPSYDHRWGGVANWIEDYYYEIVQIRVQIVDDNSGAQLININL